MNASSASARRRPDRGGPPPIRLLIVDDSTVARAVLSRMVSADPEFEVVATAGNAREALDALRTVTVDIVLLDVEMPGASGIEALPEILRAGRGAKVLVVSSMAEDGAEVTVRALAEGAADTLPKPGTGYFAGRFSQILADKLRRIGRAARQQSDIAPARAGGTLRLRAMPNHPIGCIGLGASTGGLHALLEFLRALPPKIGAPIVVTQHLPPVFMSYFARQLQTASGRPACVVDDGQPLVDEVVHIAPGDAHLAITSDSGRVRARHDRKRAPSGCLPSVDPMLGSLGDVYGQAGVGVMLSGMGRDGLIGSRLLVESGGAMLAQDQASAAVWGMPRAVAEAGLASAVMAPADLARRLAERAETAPWK